MASPSVPPRSPYHQFILSQPDEGKRVLLSIDQGRGLLENGKYNEARRTFLHTLSIYPHAVPALNNLAFISMRENDNTRALNILDQVLGIDPNEPIAHALATQCWYHLESDPMLRCHGEAALSSYITLVKLGDPVDPEYPARAFPFVLQALLLAEDDAGIVQLHEHASERPWTPMELTWAGVANFNRGRINQAHLIWRRAARRSKFEAARIYATLAQHVLSDEVLPFTLDYDIILAEDDAFPPFPSSSLALASLVNNVFKKRTRLAQESLVHLMQTDLPAQEYFLARLTQNERVPLGVRMTAALHLLWTSHSDKSARRLIDSVDESELGPSDRPAYYLLQAALLHYDGTDNLAQVQEFAEKACQVAAQQDMEWVIEYVDELLDLDEHLTPALTDSDFSMDGGDWDDEMIHLTLDPLFGDEEDSSPKVNTGKKKRPKGSKPPKGHGRNS